MPSNLVIKYQGATIESVLTYDHAAGNAVVTFRRRDGEFLVPISGLEIVNRWPLIAGQVQRPVEVA